MTDTLTKQALPVSVGNAGWINPAFIARITRPDYAENNPVVRVKMFDGEIIEVNPDLFLELKMQIDRLRTHHDNQAG
ncbi:MAG: hypothetical protein ACR2NF_05230 [Pirellulales bacterium]